MQDGKELGNLEERAESGSITRSAEDTPPTLGWQSTGPIQGSRHILFTLDLFVCIESQPQRLYIKTNSYKTRFTSSL